MNSDAGIKHIPTATYRIQLNRSFGFTAVKKIIPYLARLGISDVYASPILKARTGSLHGYDVVDPNQLNPELGSESDFDELIREARRYNIHWLQDIVPNHMAFDGQNLMLMDVMENCTNSKYFKFFDIDWDHHFADLKGRVLAPFLERFYAESLHAGEIRLEFGENGFFIRYRSWALPLTIRSYSNVLKPGMSELESKLGHDAPGVKTMNEVLSSLNKFSDIKEVHFQYDHMRDAKKALWELYLENRDIADFIDGTVRRLNGRKGEEASFDDLDNLLSAQAFRLAFWKVAIGEINYRRFFNIDELICLRVEDDDVFNYTHERILNLVKEGAISGLRIDHIDGMYDPARYLKALRDNAGLIYIAVEKVLGFDEKLPSLWEVQGTTGYDFMSYLNCLFCKKGSEKEFIRTYYRFTGLHTTYEDLVYSSKLLIIQMHMGGTIENLAYQMKTIAGADRFGRDITFYALKRALVEFMANFPVYRTYINREGFSESDRAYVGEAIAKAQKRMPALTYEFNFIERFFHPELLKPPLDEKKKPLIDFAMRLQQFTGPLMAKGFEDTVLYLYNKLISLNEVGGNPSRFGITPQEFHAFNRYRAEYLIHSMNASSTHDTKRGEDVRARLNVLSELPLEWKRNLRTWSTINQTKKRIVNGRLAPDANDEYFIYQTILGTFPNREAEQEGYVARIKNYMIKAVREAKVHTAWIKPDTEYEDACCSFIEEILKPSAENRFPDEFLPLQRKIAFYGIFNSLAQTLLKMTCPGLPDFYQGSELWDLNLVDPDNRRPVDFAKRSRFLQEIEERKKDMPGLVRELFLSKEDGRLKLLLIHRVLKARNAVRDLFEKGGYVPLRIRGARKENALAFLRRHEDSHALVVVPRMITRLVKEGVHPLGNEAWGNTAVYIPGGESRIWRNMVTEKEIPGEASLRIGTILEDFPVALLVSDRASHVS